MVQYIGGQPAIIVGSYPDLADQWGWRPGVYRAPAGYQHPWLAVVPGHTAGCWSRAQARQVYASARQGVVHG